MRGALLAVATVVVILAGSGRPARGQSATPPKRGESAAPRTSDSVTVRIVNLDLRAAVQILGQYLDKPAVFSGPPGGGVQVTLETPRPVPRSDVLRLLRGLLEANSYEIVDDTAAGMFRVRPREPEKGGGNAYNAAAAPPRIAAPLAPIQLYVIPLRHARAADVAATVNALYGRAATLPDQRERTATLGDQLRANQIPPLLPGPPQSQAAPAGTGAGLTGDVTIVAEARANSLLVRANEHDFRLIADVVRQVDVRPLQVLIEVLIAELRRDRTLDLSVEGELGKTSLGKGRPAMEGHMGTTGVGDFVLHVMGVGGLELDATLRAAAERGDVRILSRPVVITENNHEASIVVGSQRPFVQIFRSLPTDAPVRDQIVQYRDVGTKLTVRPTISADGSVQLEVTQEVSNATGETQFQAPVISTRSVQTQLIVHDGQTVALGGLTDRQKDVSQGGVPLLSSIPWIGGLFGHMRRQTTETELFLFLTPRVIRTDEDAVRTTEPMRRRAGEIRP